MVRVCVKGHCCESEIFLFLNQGLLELAFTGVQFLSKASSRTNTCPPHEHVKAERKVCNSEGSLHLKTKLFGTQTSCQNLKQSIVMKPIIGNQVSRMGQGNFVETKTLL